MSTKLWVHVADGGLSEPLSTEDIAALYADGRLKRDDGIRPAEVESWAPLWTWLPEITDPRPEGPPPPPPAKGAWTDKEPHPWRRYLARMLDSLIIGSLSWMLVAIVFYIVAPEAADRFFLIFQGPAGRILDLMGTVAMTIPGTALMVGLTGLSVGKWVFGIKVVTPEGRPIGVPAAFTREVHIWGAGLGLGIPFISLVTLFLSFKSLADDGHSAWDPPRRRILLHRPMNALQITLMVLAIPLLILARVGLAALN